jgi:hypothetical protein
VRSAARLGDVAGKESDGDGHTKAESKGDGDGEQMGGGETGEVALLVVLEEDRTGEELTSGCVEDERTVAVAVMTVRA